MMSLRLFSAVSLLVSGAVSYKAERFGALIDQALSADNGVPAWNIRGSDSAISVTELQSAYFQDRGSKRAKLTYGPFTVNPMSDGNGMNDYISLNMQMPCEDCTITYVHAGLEYPDGSYANANTSLWLHHVVFLHLGVPDTVCGSKLYAPGQRWFASGNERTVTDLSHEGKIPSGYYWPKNARNLHVLELMNQAMHPQEAILSVTFEWVPGHPSDFYDVTPVWLDIGGCGGDSDEPVTSDTVFRYNAPTYKADFEGAIISMGGHLHDGGTHIDIYKNYQTICQPHAYYGQTAGYWDQAGMAMTMNDTMTDMQMDMGDMRMPHISTMGYCQSPIGSIMPDDVIGLNAYYNLTEYSPMLNSDGSDAEIMGISLIYVAANMTESEMQKYVGYAAPEPYPDGPFVPKLSPWSPTAEMTCVPARDSPGIFSSKGLDLNDYNTAMLYLMAILDDACLQAWSIPYARGLWYGIAAVVLLAAIINRGQMIRNRMRARAATRTQSSPSPSSGSPLSVISGAFRAISYPHLTPVKTSPFAILPTLGQLMMILGYLGVICILSFVHTDTHDDQRHQSIGVRAAWISMAQLPLIVLLANKRNFVGLVTGVTYERLNILHRWTARGLLLTTTFHFGFQSYGWARLGLMKFEWSTDECPPTGIAAYAFVLWMNLSTLNVFRRLSYEFFVIQHIITFIGLIVAIMYHIPDTALSARNYVWVTIAIYVAARVWQSVMAVIRNVRPGRATLTQVSANTTKITLPSKSLRSWTPGSHIYLRFPGIGFWQSHPVTIASIPVSHSGDLVFFMRSHAGLTKEVLKAAQQSPAKNYLTLIDGPYGGAQPDLGAYSTVVLIASSTGVTFTLPILLDLASRASRHQLPVVKRVAFVWASKDASVTSWLPDELRQALTTLRHAGVRTDISIHVTGSPIVAEKPTLKRLKSDDSTSSSDIESGITEMRSADEKKDMNVSVHSIHSDSDSETEARVSSSISIMHGRCDVPTMLRQEHAAAESEMGIAVCGSLELSREVRNTVARMQGGRKGVFSHVEGFGW